jgi:hypothetical protein
MTFYSKLDKMGHQQMLLCLQPRVIMRDMSVQNTYNAQLSMYKLYVNMHS